MKEIDFLPEWYKSGRRREFSYRTQYIALAGIFVVMAVWNFTTTHSISKAKAGIDRMSASRTEAEVVSANMARIKSKLISLRGKLRSMEEIDSRIDVASVLSEMSFLIDEGIVLNEVRFIAEEFANNQDTKQNIASVVGPAEIDDGEALPVGNVRFKVVINGVAANASDVAALVCKLEDSPYFCDVVPLFLRDEQMRRGADLAEKPLSFKKNVSKSPDIFQVSGFEINCYLANYREQ